VTESFPGGPADLDFSMLPGGGIFVDVPFSAGEASTLASRPVR
jgi:hypothetical protein